MGSIAFCIIIIALVWLVLGFVSAVLGTLVLPRNWDAHPDDSEEAAFMTCLGVAAFLAVIVCMIGYGVSVLWDKFTEIEAIDKLFNRNR